MSRTLYKCEFDFNSGGIHSDDKHRVRYVVASSISDAAKALEKTRRKNLEIAEVSNNVDVVD
jgi:hypothetical protein